MTATIEPETKKATCERCCTEFEYELPNTNYARLHPVLYARRYCDACNAAAEADRKRQELEEKRQAEIERRGQYWDAVCPPLYRESDHNRLPVTLVNAADQWQFGPQGLGFIGESGKGKTRTMFRLIRRLIRDENRTVRYVPMAEFSMRIAKLGYEAEKYVGQFVDTGVLLLDDLGKGKLTDAVEGHLFHIVETRVANLRPILFTANAGVDRLSTMLSPDRAAPLLRRLGEFCDVIDV